MTALRSAGGPPARALSIVGRGRAGAAFAHAARAAGMTVVGPLARGESIGTDGAVLLCVPEHALPAVAATVPPKTLVGHCSASSTLDVLAPHEAFSVHPLLTLHGTGTRFEGATCAVDGTTPSALEYATTLAAGLGMSPLRVDATNRALYHAAASMASNFLVTLEDAAERAAAACGVPRSALVPLVDAAVRAWADKGFDGAITGPIARGDDATVQRQRNAIAESLPELLPMFDTMTAATRQALSRAHR